MKLNLLFCLLVLGQTLFAQTFTEVLQSPPLVGVYNSSVALADMDGDFDLDVLVSGYDGTTNTTKLYANDEQGNFTEVMGTPFDGVSFGSVAFADVDGTNGPDLLITGNRGGTNPDPIAKLYTNDGTGTFYEVTGTPFDGVYESSVAFADVDGDNDPDVLITGNASGANRIAKLYINNGMGNFSEVTGTPFTGVSNSSIAFADVDGDNDQDVLITGFDGVARIAKLYTNDGMGNFTEVTGTPFDGVAFSAIAFADVDGDNDQDVLITGSLLAITPLTKLYTNDGMGNFSEVTGTPFDEVLFSTVAFADVDGDNDSDVLISGLNSAAEPITKLYTNDGMANFSEVANTPFEAVSTGAILFSDLDRDSDPDVFLTGINGSSVPVIKVYTKDGVGTSIDEVGSEKELAFSLYPNPFKGGRLNIRYDAMSQGKLSLKVLDLQGRILHQQGNSILMGQQTFSVEIPTLLPGSYFLQLDDGKVKQLRKFLIH